MVKPQKEPQITSLWIMGVGEPLSQFGGVDTPEAKVALTELLSTYSLIMQLPAGLQPLGQLTIASIRSRILGQFHETISLEPLIGLPCKWRQKMSSSDPCMAGRVVFIRVFRIMDGSFDCSSR